MLFINPNTLQTVSFKTIKRDNPNVLFPKEGPDPEWLLNNQLIQVEDVAPPPATIDQVVEQAGYHEENGQWQVKYVVRDKTPLEVKQQLLNEIQTLEAGQTPRRMREASLGDTESRIFLEELNNKIIALRNQLKDLDTPPQL